MDFDPFWGDDGGPYIPVFDPEYFLDDQFSDPSSSANHALQNAVDDAVEEALEERKIAEDILERREGKQDTPIKVPLAQRNETKGHMTPFGRWATKANIDHKRAEDEIEYTKEEQLQILKAQE